MTNLPRYERNLPALLEDLYMGPSPSYRDDLLAAVGRTRQRPAWSFPERWLPVDIATRLNFAPRYPVRVIAIALLVLTLIAGALIAYVGTHRALRPALPFGPARNGDVVYAFGGDIYVGDSSTGLSRAIVTGNGFNRNPLVSPDGTHVAFLRTDKGSVVDSFDLMVANIDGTDARIISTVKVKDSDPGVWSPDGQFLLMTTSDSNLVRYDVRAAAPVVIAHETLVHDFQPPSGSKVLYEPMTTTRSLGLMNPDGTDAHLIFTIPAAETKDGCDYGTVRWSPDGTRIAFMRHPQGTGDQCRIFVMNADGTGARQLTNDPDLLYETDLEWSPDGSMIAFNRWNGSERPDHWDVMPIGVVAASGGTSRPLGPQPVGDGAAFTWSPDGKTIISAPATVTGWPPSATMPDAHPTIIDVATGASHEALWTMSSWPTWQRVGE